MLPANARVRSGEEFRDVIRHGRRCGCRTMVVHQLDTGSAAGARAGFVVSKAVGNAVVRNRVKRRLRHLARESLTALPGSAVLVVRALPASAEASSDELHRDLRRCLDRLNA